MQSRWISGSGALHSGHNRWSKIKHDKGANDRIKSKERTILSQVIMFASKCRSRIAIRLEIGLMIADGGPDPNLNSKLAIAIANAKRGQLSKTSIESAIAKGQGKSLSGAPLENLMVEAMLPHGVAAMIEYQTESKGKVLQEIRKLINKRGGSLTPTSFLFERKGKIWFQAKSAIGVDEAMDQAIEAGATDIAMEDGQLIVETEPTDLTAVSQRLQDSLKLQVEQSEIIFEPKQESMVELSSTQSAETSSLIDMIEDEPSLQNLYVNAIV